MALLPQIFVKKGTCCGSGSLGPIEEKLSEDKKQEGKPADMSGQTSQ